MTVAMYMGSWPQNIGNAFFDLGAEAQMRLSLPEERIIRTGGAVHWMFNNSDTSKFHLLPRKLQTLLPRRFERNGNSLELGQLISARLIVFAGMSVCKEFADNNGPTFEMFKKNGGKILGLGVGASNYSSDDVNPFIRMCEQIGGISLITRDENTFKLLEGKIEILHRGIDSAFFLPEYFPKPSLINNNFYVSNFDSMPEPNFVTQKNPLRTHHDLWGPLPKRYINAANTVVSDIPEDYLSIYSNADTTYSDRVHACVATLAYGNSAQFFGKTQRAKLFTEVGIEDIGTLSRLDLEELSLIKRSQLELIKKLAKDN